MVIESFLAEASMIWTLVSPLVIFGPKQREAQNAVSLVQDRKLRLLRVD